MMLLTWEQEDLAKGDITPWVKTEKGEGGFKNLKKWLTSFMDRTAPKQAKFIKI